MRHLESHPRDYVEGQVTLSGKRLHPTGIRLKGAVGSFQTLDQKPSFTLDFNRFHPGQSIEGIKKLHLNNSVEDPSYLNEWLGGTLFRDAGIPSPSVWHARVHLNGRELGLYVVKEGYSREFLQRSLPNSSGTLLEPAPRQDVRGQFHANVGPQHSTNPSALSELAAALEIPNLNRRRDALNPLLDRTQFARFMAMEVLLGHRDGYTLARNNYRLYSIANPPSIQFLPHGMDQLLQNPKAPPIPTMAGDVARSWMAIPENALLFSRTLQSLNASLLDPHHVSRILEAHWNELKGALTISESRKLRNELEMLRQRAQERHSFLTAFFAKLTSPSLTSPETNARLTGWISTKNHTGTVIEHPATLTRPASLQLSLLTPGWVSASTSVALIPGHYRFRGSVRVENHHNLPFGQHQGAFLRVAGTELRSLNLHPASSLQPLEVEFEITGQIPLERSLICELRGQSGSAWFDLESLQIERLPPISIPR